MKKSELRAEIGELRREVDLLKAQLAMVSAQRVTVVPAVVAPQWPAYPSWRPNIWCQATITANSAIRAYEGVD